MNRMGKFALLSALPVGVLRAVTALPGGRGASQEASGTPTPYHDQWPATPDAAATGRSSRPLPAAQDRATQNAMTDAGLAMIAASESMGAAAEALLAVGDPALTETGRHWEADAQSLAARGAWMITSATSESMVHDPGRAAELDLYSLRANGAVMELEGAAMAEHAHEMVNQVEQLPATAPIEAALLDDLTVRARDVVKSGEAMERAGKQMQEDADALPRSIGR